MTETESLTAVIDATSAMLVSSPPAVRVPWVFARCWLLVHRYEQRGRAVADLDLALADFDALPAGTFGRGRLAALLAVGVITCGELSRPVRLARALSLGVTADADPDPLPAWRPWAAVLRANEIFAALVDGEPGFEVGAALVELDGLAASAAPVPECVTMIETMRTAIRQQQAMVSGDLGLIDAAGRDVASVAARLKASGRPAGAAEALDVLTVMSRAQADLARGDLAAVGAALAQLATIRDTLPPGARARVHIDGMLAAAAALPLPPGTPVAGGAGSASRPAESAAESAVEAAVQRHRRGLVRLSAAGDSVDEVKAAIADLRQAVDLATAHDPRRPSYLLSLGAGLVMCYETALDPDELAAGIAVLEETRAAAARQDQHTLWTLSGNCLAHAYRLAGRHDLGRATALDSLRGHAWAALLQTRPIDGTVASRSAGQEATTVARWCVEDGDATGAAAALEAARGLTLYAAIAGRRDVEGNLIALGRDDLAREWRDAHARPDPEYAAADVRVRALTALGGLATARLLDPPSPQRVRAALVALDLDALVYLVPGDDGAGMAVIVPAEEEATDIRLPGLHASMVGTFGPVTGTRGSRDLRARTGHGLDGLCDWAWKAAMGPVLDALPVPVDRPLRLALVPMRELCRVPWHAARRTVDGRFEYVVHRATVSYAVSARMLCEAAGRSRVPLGRTGLIVADPVTGTDVPDLLAARAEAQAIRDAFYPDARYLGQADGGGGTTGGAGTPEEVLAWLRDPSGGSMLHLAVHGEAVAPADPGGLGGPDPGETSYVLLAGGRLVAETLVDTLAMDPGRGIGLAVLAGCRTGEATRTYDEAFSIGTALLAAGVRTVISTQWSVPDATTSIIMFLFHHFLRTDRLRPADALRAAQLVMLGDVPLPPSVPGALAAGAGRTDLADVLAWGGFFHSGQ